MENLRKKCLEEVELILRERIKSEETVKQLAEMALRGAEEGREVAGSYVRWLYRFKFHFVWLEKDDYLRALVRALWLAPVFAGTDFGSSRQRDMGQVWTDTARGFLGELAASSFLKSRFGVEVRLDTRRGELEEFLPTDIGEVKLPDENWRVPRVRVSFKTTKFNGRWLDVPGGQFERSDAFVLVKIGILRHHFLSFLKAISFLKDKLFASAKKIGELNEENEKKLWDEIPEFDPVPAYVAGFILKRELNLPIQDISVSVKGRTKKRIVISHGVGLFSPETVRSRNEVQLLDPNRSLPIEVEPIIDSLTSQHFFAHSGGLSHKREEWERFLQEL